MNVRYRVELSQTERAELTALPSGGKHAARKLKRAQILLAADVGASDDDIATSVGVGGSTVYRTKQRFVLGNLEAALSEQPRPGASRKLLGKEEALLVATACSKPPEGRARWTLERLAGDWSGSPSTTVSPVRPCAGDWPKTLAAKGAVDAVAGSPSLPPDSGLKTPRARVVALPRPLCAGPKDAQKRAFFLCPGLCHSGAPPKSAVADLGTIECRSRVNPRSVAARPESIITGRGYGFGRNDGKELS
jgi:transposase